MSESTSPLENLEPRLVWQHFDAIRRVPRPSKKEEKIVAHVRDWAADHGFPVRADAAGNLVVSVPARPGREAAPTVVLQAHLDMVCEKNADSVHNFDHDPIAVEVRGDWVHAVGTTLGADNGLGAAAAMAAAVDPDLDRGPLELLFTLDEETGLNGAAALDPSLVSGRVMINLDTEEDGAVYIGCAGAAGLEGRLAIARAPHPGRPLRLAIRGLRGGHSGVEIHDNRGNAIKVAARLLSDALDAGIDLGLVSIDGGDKANAIPRECFAELLVDERAEAALRQLLAEEMPEIRALLAGPDPGLEVVIEESPGSEGREALTNDLRDRLVHLLAATPHGVLAMSREVPGLVETSNNLAVVACDEAVIRVVFSYRSSLTPALSETTSAMRSLCALVGAESSIERGYPGWQPDPEAPLVRRTAEVYERLYGKAAEVKAVHAGLECGILAEKVPGLTAVSIGPDIRGAHSPDERASIPSTARFYALLGALLADLATAS